ncbi:MAG TPA: WD40 repeat domain-containing protein, partial [Anaerolineales bacterium]|nr:WD40 repeat domain-containing protein [Anaerolineales bacterium]
ASDTRRTALFDELVPAGTTAGDVLVVVQKLADARLIITDEQAGRDTVTISHEKLIDAWPWLRKLVNENRDVIALQNEIINDAKEWQERGRDPSYLYSGARLANAREQLAAKKLVLSGTAHEFVQASRLKQRRAQVTAIAGIASIMALLAFAVILFGRQANTNAALAQQNAAIANTAQAAGTQAVAEKVTAQENAREAQRQASYALASLALAEKDQHFSLSQLLGITGFMLDENPQTKSILLNLTNSYPQLYAYRPDLKGPVNGLSFSPDGSMVAASGCTKYDYLQDSPVNTGIPVCTAGEIILWDLKKMEEITRLATLSGFTGNVESVAFSWDNKMLASGACTSFSQVVSNTCNQGNIGLWDISDPAHPILRSSWPAHASDVQGLAFSPVSDHKFLASAGLNSESDYRGNVIFWDVSNPNKPVQLSSMADHTFNVSSFKISPDGNLLASASYDGTIGLWNVSDPAAPALLSTMAIEFSNRVLSISFSPDGKSLVSGNDNNTIIWDITEPTQPVQQATISGSSGAFDPNPVALSRDGGLLASRSCGPGVSVGPPGEMLGDYTCPSGAVTLWDLSGFPSKLSVLPQLEQDTAVTNAAFSPVKNELVLGMDNGSISFWNLQGSSPLEIAALPGNYVAYSQTADMLAIRAGDADLTLWGIGDLTSPRKLSTLSAERIAFGPGNKSAASVLGDHVDLWDLSDLTNPRKMATVSDPGSGKVAGVRDILFSPDGQLLVSAGCKDSNDNYCIQGQIGLWNVSDLQHPRKIATLLPAKQEGGVQAIAFDPSGSLLAAGTDNSAVILWNVIDPAKPLQTAMIPGPESALANPVTSVRFSLVGSILAAGYFMDHARIWDLRDPSQPLELADLTSIGRVTSVVFDSTGKTFAAGGVGGIRVWDTSEPAHPVEATSLSEPDQSYLSFSPNGKLLVGYAGDFTGNPGGIVVWDMDPRSWIQVACQRAGRNFTRAEWKRYFPNETYRKTCEQWPLEPEPVPSVTP